MWGWPPRRMTESTFGSGLGELNEELDRLNVEAAHMQEVIAANVATLLADGCRQRPNGAIRLAGNDGRRRGHAPERLRHHEGFTG